MKTLKTFILGLALMIAGTAAFANQTPPMSKTDVLNVYVNALVNGQVTGVENVLDKNVKHTINRGEKQFNLDKKQILAGLKASENVKQGCAVNTFIVDETDDSMVVKVVMKYEGFTRTNVVTISANKAEFKITKIETLG